MVKANVIKVEKEIKYFRIWREVKTLNINLLWHDYVLIKINKKH